MVKTPSPARLIAVTPVADRAIPVGWPGARSGAAGFVGAAVERLALPHADLFALGVGEPVDPLTGGVDGGMNGAAGPVGDLAGGAGRAVPGVDLPRPGDVRAVDRAAGGQPCPGWQRHARRPEPGVPAFLGLHPVAPPPSADPCPSGRGLPSSIAPASRKYSRNVGEFRTKCPISNMCLMRPSSDIP